MALSVGGKVVHVPATQKSRAVASVPSPHAVPSAFGLLKQPPEDASHAAS